MVKHMRGRNIKATTVRVTILPILMVGMLVLADSCSCPFLSSYGGASEENATAEAHPKSSPTASAPTSPPALVRHNFQYNQTLTNTVSFPHDVSTGDLILVAITTNETIVADVKDNHSTYQSAVFQRVGLPLTATSAPLSDHVDLWYASHVPGGPTTITVSFSAPPDSSLDANSVGIYEYSGFNQTSPYQRVAATGSGTTPDAGQSPTPLPRTGLYFVVGVDGGPDVSGAGNAPVMAGSGFTLEDQQDDPDFERFYAEDRIATEAANASFSIAYPATWGVICAVFTS